MSDFDDSGTGEGENSGTGEGESGGTVEGESGSTSWLGSIGDWFSNLISKLGELVSNIGEWFSNLISNLGEWFAKVGEWILSIPQTIADLFKDLFIYLFVPTEDHFGQIKDKISSKFPIIEQVTELSSKLLGFSYGSEPVFNVSYNGVTYNILDLSAFASYRVIINGIILALCYFGFIRRLLRRIPKLIGGI